MAHFYKSGILNTCENQMLDLQRKIKFFIPFLISSDWFCHHNYFKSIWDSEFKGILSARFRHDIQMVPIHRFLHSPFYPMTTQKEYSACKVIGRVPSAFPYGTALVIQKLLAHFPPIHNSLFLSGT